MVASRASGINISRFSDAKFDALIEQADNSADLGARAALLRQAEARAMQEQPLAPLYYYVSRRLISPRVQGWVDNPRGIHLQRYLSLAD